MLNFLKVPELVGFAEEETKTRFTNYSMSSSIIRRNKELSLLDDKFERYLYTTEYYSFNFNVDFLVMS